MNVPKTVGLAAIIALSFATNADAALRAPIPAGIDSAVVLAQAPGQGQPMWRHGQGPRGQAPSATRPAPRQMAPGGPPAHRGWQGQQSPRVAPGRPAPERRFVQPAPPRGIPPDATYQRRAAPPPPATVERRDWQRPGATPPRFRPDPSQFQRRGNWAYYHHHRGSRHYVRGWYPYMGWWFPPAAFAIIASEPVYAEPAVDPMEEHYAWCHARYRSYREIDNTFKPRHGPRRECVSPYYP
ncbi:BA14K family protein [Alsobacter sp. SYSU M60028]|uniref:Lectin-like protein BA14k n=1 Tax=Alsobacter ponti TaxID=2962936 RepID=A0ABT1LD32_9HYPH|nr:BA14K family protein [Alsobacter ponti]MCP8939415.1 BA14K family protein [Alsobacter ponti]